MNKRSEKIKQKEAEAKAEAAAGETQVKPEAADNGSETTPEPEKFLSSSEMAGTKPLSMAQATDSPLAKAKIIREHVLGHGPASSQPAAGAPPTPSPTPTPTPAPGTTNSPPPPATNGANTGFDLPPKKNFDESSPSQPPGTSSAGSEAAGGTPPNQGSVASPQAFGPTAPDPANYTMPGNYAKRTANDMFNGINYAMKWNVAPLFYVKYKGDFVKFHKATEHVAQYDTTQKPSGIKDRLQAHNKIVRDKMAFDEEDRNLIVPAAAEWFEDTGFHMSPGGKVAMAAGQIVLRKLGDISDIYRENNELKEELKFEVNRFLEVYNNKIKPDIERFVKEQKAAEQQPPPPPAPPKPSATKPPKPGATKPPKPSATKPPKPSATKPPKSGGTKPPKASGAGEIKK